MAPVDTKRNNRKQRGKSRERGIDFTDAIAIAVQKIYVRTSS